jgi:Lar family restriction alleviation protein
MADLLPCPFCGGTDIGLGNEGSQWTGVCRGCDTVSAWTLSRESCVTAWNRREDPNRLPMELVPEGWQLSHLVFEGDDGWFVTLEWNGPSSDDRPDYRKSNGPTPHAAMMAAIGKIGQ